MRTRLAIAMSMILASVSIVRVAPDIGKQLEEADRLAWLNDWYGALPVYVEAEKAATSAGNRRAAMYAKFGRLRGQMQTRSLAELSEEIGTDLLSPIAKQDAALRLRGFTVKGDIDLEWDVDAAQQDWRQVQQLAKELDDKGWDNRATGELALVAFLKGNTREAGTLIQQALQAATQSGDVGGQLRYLGAVANGLLSAGFGPVAMGYADRALTFAKDHPETGFPFVVYSTKVLALLALNKPDEAEQFAKAAMAEAHAGDRRIKEIELLMLLAQIAEKRNQHDRAAEYLEDAITKANAGQVQRLLADAEEGVAGIYRARSDLPLARRHALAAVAATETAGNRFMLPVRLGVLADIYAAEGRLAEADRTYDQAADIVEGIMVNVPSREAQARLIGVMSDLYTGHFRLAAERLNAPARAYQIIERARGRAVADILRSLPDTDREVDAPDDRLRTISRLQVRLMKARAPAARKQILNDLWEAEQRTPTAREGRANLLMTKNLVNINTIQQRLAVDEVILEYVLTEPRSYCLVLSRGELKLVPLPSRKQIEPLVDRFTDDIRSGKAAQSPVTKELYDAVLQPIARWRTTKRMFVVPDGKLHVVPFDSLLTLNAAPAQIVTVLPSANVWYLLRTGPRRMTPDRPLLAIGGVPYDRMFAAAPPLTSVKRSDETRGLFDAAYPSKLSPLPTAQAEVLAAARQLGPRSVVLTGEQATESALKSQNLGSFEILHFAVHAFADPNFPERAALVLLNDAAGGEDGLLQPREIGRMSLNASVVVLCACDTAVGPILGQEGVLNVARAFLSAGAQSVVTTLWAVSDDTSAALMRRFYENLTAGRDIAEALMRSKAAVMEQFGPKALSTVSAFQLIGVGDRRITFKNPPPRVAADQRQKTFTTH